MRACILLAVFVMLLGSAPLLAEEAKPPMDLPVYPGAESTMEVNLTSEDILPMLQAMLPLMTAGKGKLADALRPEDIGEILKDVKRIEFIQLEANKKTTTIQQILSYYSTNLPNGKWSRIYYKSDPNATLAVFADPDQESYYGYRIRPVTVDGRVTKRIEAAKLVGKIDLVKLLTLAGKYAQASLVPSTEPAAGSSDGYQFDPGHPRAEEYMVNVAMDVVNNFDVDGIQFDRVRFTGPTWGYNPTSVSRFHAVYGGSGNPSYTDANWCQWRRDQITNFIRKAYAKAIAVNPDIEVSAAVVTWAGRPGDLHKGRVPGRQSV